jgi:NADH dehydrogenase
MARLPILPVIAGKRNFQPVFVRDLGQAIALAALDPGRHAGKSYEIGGPQKLNMVELHREVLSVTGQTPGVVELPDIAGKFLSWFAWLPGAPLTKDQWLMLQRDNVPTAGAEGLEAFGIRPTPLAAVGREWLGRFHRGGKYGGSHTNLTAIS